MKISEIKSNATTLVTPAAREDRRVDTTGNKASFGDAMIKAEQSDTESKMRKLIADIERQGDILGKTMDLRELKKYKKLISEFMDEAVSSSLEFSKQSFFDRRGRHKVYAQVKKINAKVEELSREFLKDEKDNIKILESIGSIKGMLMDVYM